MKRKLIASLLCLCMIVSLLPVAAFATEGTTPPPPVIAANIVDKSGTPLTGDDLYTGTPTATLDNSTKTITVTVNNLARHKASDGAGMGYWVGVGIPMETGDAYAVGWGATVPDGAEYKVDNKDDTQTVSGKEYATFYFDAIKGDTAYISVQSTPTTPASKEGEPASKTTTTYKVDLSNVTLKLDVVPANLTGGTTNRPQGDNADVYTVSGVKTADGIPTITVKATGLKEHANAQTPAVTGYWVGVGLPTITAPEGGSVKYAWGFGEYPSSIATDNWKVNTRYQGDGNKYTTFYFAANGTTDKWSDGAYIAVQITNGGKTTTYHYNITFDVQTYSSLAINGMGFEAVAADANTAINRKVQLNTPVGDCDENTMYAYFNSLFQGNDTVPVELVFKNPKDEVVYTWKNTAVRVVYFAFKDGTGSPASKPISSGTYTAELKVGGTVVSTKTLDIYSVSFDAAGGTAPGLPGKTYYEKGKEVTLPTGLTKTNSVFTGWKDDKGNVVSGAQTVTGDVTYTAQWDEVKIISASLKQNTGEPPADVAGVSATVDGTTIKLTGSIAQPANGGTAYKLAYTTNAASLNTGVINVTLNYADQKLTATVTNNVVNGKTYTVNVDDLKVLPANVTIADGGVAAVDEKEIAAPGLTTTEKTTLVNNIKATTGSFDTQSEALSAQLTETATSLTPEEVTSKLDEAKENIEDTTVADTYTTLAVVPVLSIDSVDYDRANEEMTLEITPAVQYEAVSTTPGNDNIPVGKPIPMSKEDAAKVGAVAISFKTPAFVTPAPSSSSDKLYVTHTASAGTYEYTATYNSTDSVYTFTNPHGFSTFVVSKTSDAVAYIGEVGYMTLKEAVEAAEDNDTIVLHKKLTGDAATITASLSSDKTLKFKDFDSSVKNGTLKINGKDVAISTTEVTVTIPKSGGTTPVDPSNPGSSGGNSGGSTTKPTDPTNPTDPTDPGNTGKTNFTDVPAGAYYEDAVKWAVDKGITNGLTATTFGPNNSCTRGQMVTFLWRAAGSPAATGTNSFTDVASGEYYYNAVLWAVEKGITNGTSATTFSPNATVNRGQTVTFLYRYAESPAATGDTSFTDVTADAFYADAVKWAVAEGITNGTSDTTFAPASNCTRGQIVTFMYRQMAE